MLMTLAQDDHGIRCLTALPQIEKENDAAGCCGAGPCKATGEKLREA
jgi:hypothetical protein